MRDTLEHVFWRWTILFLLINVLVPKIGGPNAYSRMATLASMAEGRGFEIGGLIERFQWTNDWSKTSDGRYFSNKAPGPTLLAYPVYFLLDRFQTSALDTSEERDERRWHNKHLNIHLLSLLFQVLLTIGLARLADKLFASRGVSETSRELFLIALYFASLSSLFMNTYFGHALASSLVLGSFLFYHQKQYVFAGLFLGLSLLSDYSAGMFLILFLCMGLFDKRLNWKFWTQLVLGGFLPFLLWAWYHISCFGGILETPLSHLNPDFVTYESSGLSGIFHALPDGAILLKLLFGWGRGLLMTSPWILLVLILLFRRLWAPATSFEDKRSMAIAVLYFLGLLFMNAAFATWEAGSSPGSRYLSTAFPLLAFVFFYWAKPSIQEERWIAWLMLPSLVFFAAVYATTLLLPANPLWPELFARIFTSEKSSSAWRFFAIVTAFGVCGYRSLTSKATSDT